jgi:Domain of unknown function (DUF4262)
MCWKCDDPALTPEEYLARMARLVRKHCWVVQGVRGERGRPPWSYTVGLTSHQRPELITTGLQAARAAALLDGVAAHLVHATAPAPGEQVRLVSGPLVEFVEVDHPEIHLAMARALYGPAVRALQVVWADDRDHWPWDEGFRSRRGGQPVLGRRAR